MIDNDIKRIKGVQYVTTYGSKLRVVFSHNANTDAIQKVEEITDCSGKIGATQEHLACVDYPKTEIDKNE